jgi:hypothetical protein
VTFSNADLDFVLDRGNTMTTKEKYPSLHLAYEQVKNVLPDQIQTASVLETKASTLFAIATAMIGIVLPIGLNRITSDKYWLVILTVIPISLYLYAWWLFRAVYSLKSFAELGDPKTIEDYLNDSPDEFMKEAIRETKKAYEHNEGILEKKREMVRCLLPIVITEMMTLVAWSVIILVFTI